MFKAHRLLHQSTLGSRVIKQKQKRRSFGAPGARARGVGLDAVLHGENAQGCRGCRLWGARVF